MTSSGETIETRAPLSGGGYEIGDSVEIYYVVNEPTTVTAGGRVYGWTMLIIGSIGSLVLIAYIVMWLAAMFTDRRT